MKYLLGLFTLLIITAIGCTNTEQQTDKTPSESKEVNVYTHRHYDTDAELFAKFEEETGIKVNVVKASADELINRLETEGAQSPADALISVDAGRLHRAKEKGLLQPLKNDKINQSIPANLRDSEGYWIALTQRARILVYAKDRVNPSDLSTYEALTDKKWKGKLLARSSSNIYNQSLLASKIAHDGEAEAKTWAQGIVANMARDPKGNDRDQVKAIAQGTGDIAIVNSYYIGKMINSDKEEERKAVEAVNIFFPKWEKGGTHINVSGIGICKHAPNKANAEKLIAFLADTHAQNRFAEANYEYPAKTGIEASELLKSWGSFEADKINLEDLGKLNKKAVMTFDEAGWK